MTRISANRRENRVQRPVYMYGLSLPRFFLFLVDDKEITEFDSPDMRLKVLILSS